MVTLGNIGPLIASHISECLICIGGRKHDEQCHKLQSRSAYSRCPGVSAGLGQHLLHSRLCPSWDGPKRGGNITVSPLKLHTDTFLA